MVSSFNASLSTMAICLGTKEEVTEKVCARQALVAKYLNDFKQLRMGQNSNSKVKIKD